ncbi:MAG: hypothetical protein KatS3mg118_0297 [Paracoccaceae bacterium]|nr:MAG: hypothetical protein KatS3mg118_0297 [Paracoccaceae bacterium]
MGENSAGLCTTVQPAARAGAIFQVDSMKGVFHGVITPTGPIGTRPVMFIRVGLGRASPSRADGARSAKKRKFSAPRSAALDMKRQACPVSQHSSRAISSARASMASAMRWRRSRRRAPSIAAHSGNAARAARAAASTSSAPLRATSAIGDPSTGDSVRKVRPEAAGRSSPAIRFRTGPAAWRASSSCSRARLSSSAGIESSPSTTDLLNKLSQAAIPSIANRPFPAAPGLGVAPAWRIEEP